MELDIFSLKSAQCLSEKLRPIVLLKHQHTRHFNLQTPDFIFPVLSLALKTILKYLETGWNDILVNFFNNTDPNSLRIDIKLGSYYILIEVSN